MRGTLAHARAAHASIDLPRRVGTSGCKFSLYHVMNKLQKGYKVHVQVCNELRAVVRRDARGLKYQGNQQYSTQ